MATRQNIINRISGDLTVDPGASGDSWIQFSLITSDKFRMGVEDGISGNDPFKISIGNAFSTNDAFIADVVSDGQIVLPLQPAFMARMNANSSSVTGDGTTFTLGSDTAWVTYYDQNSNFNPDGTFTAPVTGRYTFESCVLIDGFLIANNAGYLTFNASNRDVICGYANPYVGSFLNLFYTYSGSISIDMDAADTIVMQITVSNGLLSVNVRGTGDGRWTNFSGRLSV